VVLPPPQNDHQTNSINISPDRLVVQLISAAARTAIAMLKDVSDNYMRLWLLGFRIASDLARVINSSLGRQVKGHQSLVMA